MPTFETIASILNRKGHEIYSLLPDKPVIESLALMARKRVAVVLVISEGMPLGIVSAKDYGRKIVLEGRSPQDVRLREIMSSPAITVSPDAGAADGLRGHDSAPHSASARPRRGQTRRNRFDG